MARKKVLITTIPFGEMDERPLNYLHSAGLEVVRNPVGRRLTATELAEIIPGIDYLIAGTEQIDRYVLSRATNLKLIARVGIGLDSVDLDEARRLRIPVTYTPDAPTDAVAELAIGLMICGLRHIHIADEMMHQGGWYRHFGRRLGDVSVGILGLGRIGSRLSRQLAGFNPRRVIGFDVRSTAELDIHPNVEVVALDELIRESDVLSIHVPLSESTRGLLGLKELRSMKPDSVLINTARGGIVDEVALLEVLASGHFSCVALDVFEEEPYTGPLSENPRVLMTSHMGSMSVDSRNRMELEATEEVLRFHRGDELMRLVPAPEARSDGSR